MKRGEVFFHPMEGSGQLSISWSSAPKGAAVEAKKGNGVGFFSTKGDLLSVIFDDVFATEDYQVLEFKKHRIEVFIKNETVRYKLTQLIRSNANKKTKRTNRQTLKHPRSKIKR